MRLSEQDKVKELAKLMQGYLTTGKRDNGKTFVMLKDSAKDWMRNVCHKAHGDTLPDDYTYLFIQDALEAIVEADNLDEADTYLAADTYTNKLLTWLSSMGSRCSYVDQAIENYGKANTIMEDIRNGQFEEMREVLNIVIIELSKLDLDDIKNELSE